MGGKADAAINELMKIHPKGFDLSLDRITSLLAKLGNPQTKIPPVIHVAGTNGKGSAIAFARAVLEAHGMTVHVHTSPHLVNWHERYRLAGTLVSDDVLADAINRVAQANGGQPITVFEVLTAVTFVLFSEHPADVCLIEVGLGGRFDATNVMPDETVAVSVITPVAMDHEAYLGDTLAKIAFEKAGIIRRGVPVVVGPQEDDALDVIERQAAKMHAPVSATGQHFSATLEDGRMLYQGEDVLYDLSPPRLPGLHQIDNAATAIAATRQFLTGRNQELSADTVEAGLATATWPGRLQAIQSGALKDKLGADTELWIDGGHNPHAGAVVADWLGQLQQRDPRKVLLIAGMLNTKDPSGYFATLEPLKPQVITVPITSSDAGVPAAELAQIARGVGLDVATAASLIAAIDMAQSDEPLRVLIAGSLYLAGDALAANGTPPT
ncbi:MAG: folylpolyglutamate synthase/dihydrofolate synthase family protein [Pseudomonadota bacterium]